MLIALAGLLTAFVPGELQAAQTTDERQESSRNDEPDCPKRLEADRTPDARALTLLGVRCFKAGHYAQAYTYYHRAYEVRPSDTLRAAMGRSLHELGIYGVARTYYQSFLEGGDNDPESTRKIEKRLDQLSDDVDSNGVPTNLRSFPADATVYLELGNGDWVEIGETPTAIDLRASRYRFTFALPDHRHRRVERQLSSSSAPATLAVDLYPLQSTFDASARDWKRAGLVAGLGSLPFLGTGALFFGLSGNQFEEVDEMTDDGTFDPERREDLRQQAHQFRRLAIGFTAAGATAAVTGGVLWLRGRALEPAAGSRDETKAVPEETASLTIRPVVSPRWFGLHARF